MTRSQGDAGPQNGTVSAFVVGLVVVVGAGVLIGRVTESYLAVAFAAYFLTTLYDLAVERNRYREVLLDALDAHHDESPEG